MREELTAAEAAERLQVGRSTVNLWCRQGRLPGARREDSPVGSYWLIPVAALKTFVKPKRGPVPKVKPEKTPRRSSRKSREAKP
ncbi:MAG: helix-turn-helix domain-containing protein [Pyrinomonadaceae bacterium]